MIAKTVPEIAPKGQRNIVAHAYGLTVQEFNCAYQLFVYHEGFSQIDGYECQNLHEWLIHEPKPQEMFEPFQKSDEYDN